jgi:hypothetical protein
MHFYTGQLVAGIALNKEGSLSIIELMGMRIGSTAKQYAQFLFICAKYVAGTKIWKDKCVTEMLDEYFTLTNQALLS